MIVHLQNKKRIIALLIALCCGWGTAWASYSFSATVSGKTLYFNIVSGTNVEVCYPGTLNTSTSCGWDGYTKPTGAVSIPSTVTNNGTTYSVKYIGNYAFAGCTGITSVSIPSSIICRASDGYTNTGMSGKGMWFKNCSGLTSITLPNSSTFTCLPYQMCSMCTSLSSISIPSRITDIGPDCFVNTALTSVTIPSSVTTIYGGALTYNQNLSSITVQASTPPTLYGYSQFDQNASSLVIYVPCESRDTYRSAWSSYSSKIQGYGCPYTITAYASPSAGGTVTGGGGFSSGQTCTLTASYPNTGYNFVNWTKSGSVVSTNRTYSFVVYSSGTYVANYAKEQFSISASASPTAGGTISGAGTYEYGTTCTLTATANAGYTFTNWKKGSTVVSTNPSYSFTVTQEGSYTATFTINSYTINASASPTEGGNVTGAGTYNHGASVTLTATNTPGYTFVNWKKGSTVVSTNSTYSFSATADGDYVAFFSRDNYTVSVSANPSTGGVVSGGGTFQYGDNCTVTATPATDNIFTKWTKNGVVVSTNPSYTFQVTGNANLVAHFGNYSVFTAGASKWFNFAPGNLQYQPSTQTWRFAPNQSDFVGYVDSQTYLYGTNDGWIDLFGWGTSGYNHGAVCYLPTSTSTTNSDYYAYGNYQKDLNSNSCQADWGYNAISNGGNTTNAWHTPTQVEWNYILNIRNTNTGIRYAKAIVGGVKGLIILPDNWQTSYYTLNNTNTPEVAYSSNNISASNWTNMELYGAIFLPATGYREGITYAGEGGSDGYWSSTHKEEHSAYFLAMNNEWLHADWDRSREIGLPVRLVRTDQSTTYQINATPNSTNGGTVTGTRSYPTGAYCTLYATPNTGYTFVNWTEDNTIVSTNSQYGFVVSGARTLVANFTANTYTVTLNTNGGTINSGNVTSYTYGVGATLPTNVTKTGYTFGGWYDNSNLTGSAVTSISTTATGNKTFWAKWTANVYTVTLNTNGGTINSGNITSYTYGVGATLPTDVTKTGCIFGGWYNNSNLTGSAVTNISSTATGNKTFWAKWTNNSYCITASAHPTAGGTVNGAGTFEHGSTCTLIATPATGYTFTDWKKDNTVVSTNASYQFTVTEAATYIATFTINSYAITASADPTNGGTVMGAGNYNHGTQVTLTATPSEGYHFVNWTKGNTQVSTSPTYTFTATQAGAFVAHFELNSYTLTINYKYADGTTAAATHTESVNYNATYSVASPDITGYTADQPVVTGTMGTENVTVDVTYNINSYTLTINYKYADGTTAAATHTESVDYNATYSVASPDITGYTADQPMVTGTMGTENVTVNVTYSINSYTLTINYQYADGTTAATTHTENVNYNATYSVASPDITGYTADQPMVTGTMGTENVTVNVTYSINSYTLTINYQYADGTTAATTHTENVNYNATYSVASPDITGYTADQPMVTGTMGTENVTVNVTYSINSYTLTINYLYADGTPAATTHTESVDYNATYSVASPDITGYTADQPVVTGTMGTEDVTVNVTYSINSYTLTINYKYADGTTAAATHTESVDYNATYSVASPDITGYTADQPVVTGTMGTENVTVNVTYNINSYTLTINYKYADGTSAAATHTESVDYNATYSVASPVITGYTADQPVVTGTMGTENVTVNVTYNINSYTLTINYLYADGTTAATTHTENVDYNATYSVASPDIMGYTADQPMVTGTMGTEDVTVDVTYSINSYSITVSASEGGSATGDGTYNYGATATLMASANEGYTFVNWTENGNVVSTNATYSFTVLSDRDLVANFQIESYTIVVSASEGGTVTGGGTYDYGTNVTLSATAMDGYIFVNWTEDGIEVSTEANYSFIVNSNRTLVAHFEEYHNHWIPVSSGSSGVMTLLAKIQINGVDQNSDQLELGVFCGTECRGSKIAHLLDIPSENLHYYLVDPLVYGDSGETFSFKLYNHEIGEEMDLIAPDPIAYTENGYGELRDPYVLNFLSTVQITASVDPENAGTVTGTGNHTIGTSCTLSAIANEGFQFMNWTLNGAVVSTEASYTFMVSESSHYVAHFAFVHSQPMTNGWNWWSTYIEMEGVDGLDMLKNSLGASCVRIQARYGYLDNLGSSWYGSLTSIENEQMYKIRTNAPCTVVIVGNAALPQNHPIIINEGWNWIGFPCSETTSIGTALQSFGPEVNDLIKSREGYASYLSNNYWYGSINAFEPGKGYMYKSNSSSSKTLQFTAGRGEENIAMNDHTGSRLFEPVVESFASNMTVTAVVDVDGEELRSEEYEVSAFVGNECRGSVKLMYIEPLDRYIAFLLVFGEDGEEITFTLTDGRGVCISEDVMVYSNDGMVGTLTEPANLHFGLDGLWDNEQMQIHVYPNPSKNIFNIEGVNLRRIEVVDGFGQVILSSEIEGDHIQINLGDRAIGTYLLRVITDSGIVSKKLIKTL